MKKIFPLLIIIILVIPSFFLMLRFGLYSMQDFHFFRLVEFDNCIKNFQIPCRWSFEAGLGYGEPLFNFYGQGAYIIGEVFHLLKFSLVDSLKLSFIFSLLGSGISMFYLARKTWKSNAAAILSSIFYVYAPYRALDVWVRGALPESLSFVIFPLIILFFENYLETKHRKQLVFFALALFMLIITHNLSLVLFSPFLLIWIIYRLFTTKKLNIAPKLVSSALLSLGLSAFYVLPVLFESKYITLESTTTGYFDFRAHFATLQQLLFSRFWGYGGSTWGMEDGLSLSVGLFHWLIPLVILFWVILRRKLPKYTNLLLLILLGIFYLFLTHNQSTFIWLHMPFMKYIQFPWRFLGVAVFCFSLSIGAVVQILSKRFSVIILVLALGVILYNLSFFRPDIWYKVSDTDLTTGDRWVEQTRSSIGDFWPKFGHEIPTDPSDGQYINYFPGWNYEPDENGLIRAEGAVFSNTPVRTTGNIISGISAIVVAILLIK